MWLTAALTVQDGKQAEFEAVFKDLAAQVRANEPGNLEYTLTKKRGSTTEYVVIEHYRDASALEAHGKSDHFRAASPKLGACLAGAPVMSFFDPV